MSSYADCDILFLASAGHSQPTLKGKDEGICTCFINVKLADRWSLGQMRRSDSSHECAGRTNGYSDGATRVARFYVYIHKAFSSKPLFTIGWPHWLIVCSTL